MSTLSRAGLPLQTNLQGTEVIINGVAAPLFFVSPEQINAQVPWELASAATLSVEVRVFTEPSNTVSVPGRAAAPGIFRVAGFSGNQGAILLSAGELAAPVGSLEGARPARPGEFIEIYCTGLGTVTNQPASGTAATTGPLSNTTQVPTVTIGDIAATVTYSGLAPFFVGLYQVNVQIPVNTPRGNSISVALTIGGLRSNTVTMAIQ